MMKTFLNNIYKVDEDILEELFSAAKEIKENIYGNRSIADYIRGNALFQLLEADRIKEDIRDREMDMWNY